MLKTLFVGLALTAGSALAASREVTLTVPGARLGATLSTPDGLPNPPVALILAGSGPTDRDGNAPPALKSNAYLKLAEALNTLGVATLRPDKRGVGASTAADPREEAVTFDTFVQDARAWMGWLRAQKTFGKLVLIGHSEGSLVGLVALQDAPADAFVSLAGLGSPYADTLRRQLRANPNNPQALLDESDRILTELSAGRRVSAVSPLLAPLFRPSVQPFLISAFKYDPAALIGKLKVPTLIVQGDRDLQVTVQDAQMLAKAQPGAILLVVPGMNHLLVDAPADVPGNLATYTQPGLPLSPAFLDGLGSFLNGALK